MPHPSFLRLSFPCRRRRLSCLVVASLLVAAMASCVVPSRTLRADEEVTLSGTEGYVALAADLPPTANVLASLCQDGDVGRCVMIGPLRNDSGVRIYSMPPGRYCVAEYAFDNGMQSMHVQLMKNRMACFDVAADTLSYPGHLGMRVKHTQMSTSLIGYRFTPVAGIEERTRTTYPRLTMLPFETVEVMPLLPRETRVDDDRSARRRSSARSSAP